MVLPKHRDTNGRRIVIRIGGAYVSSKEGYIFAKAL